jgi:hypothetical protein
LVTDGIWLRFRSGPELDSLGLTRREIVDAVEETVREHGEGRTILRKAEAADVHTLLRFH